MDGNFGYRLVLGWFLLLLLPLKYSTCPARLVYILIRLCLRQLELLIALAEAVAYSWWHNELLYNSTNRVCCTLRFSIGATLMIFQQQLTAHADHQNKKKKHAQKTNFFPQKKNSNWILTPTNRVLILFWHTLILRKMLIYARFF